MTNVSEDMKRATGVQKRPGSTSWHWGIKAPSDLKHLYAGQWAHRCSLETADLRLANSRATALRAEWVKRFDQQREAKEASQRPLPSVKLSPALIKEACDLMYARMLESDESQRLEGLSAQQMENQALALGIEKAKLRDANASGSSTPVDNVLPAWLRWLHWEVSEADPLYRVLVRELVKTRLKARRRTYERLRLTHRANPNSLVHAALSKICRHVWTGMERSSL
ncbi:DUF6538 domain-containing protein [Roseateles chitinivorans]|uniref:DUF6538 domain-containing protein n=1 Tax=Roseateles chitinivorans TaxID=2917965 RepID=UPI003D664271